MVWPYKMQQISLIIKNTFKKESRPQDHIRGLVKKETVKLCRFGIEKE